MTIFSNYIFYNAIYAIEINTLCVGSISILYPKFAYPNTITLFEIPMRDPFPNSNSSISFVICIFINT